MAEEVKISCPWVGPQEIYQKYHDTEWGVPVADDIVLFKKLVLEGFQAGLSWITILNKRAHFVSCFDQFDPQKIARYGAPKVAELMRDKGIVRNRQKIEATISNAQAYLKLVEERSLAAFMWDFVDGTVIDNQFSNSKDIPAKTALSDKLSKALKQKGFRFCGPVGVYALMQSAGLVNDHLVNCHRYEPCRQLAQKFIAPTV